ncbi:MULTISPECIES: hypothetical protein [unclassified Butyrivibrio]|uniref:hypothetical protein n=1 Tax=unclassified Butyrivibrio TaxID=2639466 RepID=UPI000479F63D|nr:MULTISPECIES: hypothetical protein [unclassified Butyrivibrio]
MGNCLCAAIDMPLSYSLMDEEEMTYVEGGGSTQFTDTAEAIRGRLDGMIGLAATADLIATFGKALGFIPLQQAIMVGVGVIATSYVKGANDIYSDVEKIIRDKGKRQLVQLTLDYSVLWICTGMSVKAVNT